MHLFHFYNILKSAARERLAFRNQFSFLRNKARILGREPIGDESHALSECGRTTHAGAKQTADVAHASFIPLKRFTENTEKDGRNQGGVFSFLNAVCML